MRLTRHRRRAPRPQEEGLREAERAVRESQCALEVANSRSSEVRDLGAQLRKLREQNHFSARIARMLREAGENAHEHGH